MANPWIEHMRKHMRGKKFQNRAEINAFVKKLAQEYRASKANK